MGDVAFIPAQTTYQYWTEGAVTKVLYVSSGHDGVDQRLIRAGKKWDYTLAMLVVQPITPADIATITALWYDGFRTSGFLALIPDTPGVRQWWNDANLHDLMHKPTARYWKVVDDAMPGGAIIAYAKWDMESAEDRGDRFPPWHRDMDTDGCSDFFGRLERQRQEIFQGRNNYCISPPLVP
ncbi:hypothetical protein LTS12_029734 [Elasticomyces elasticus]|nr:hypothetical protein LTS12_029734 [Elasticomyces elasticus]